MSKALRGLVLIVAVAIVGAASLNSSTAQDKKDKDKGKDAKATAVFELYKDKQDEFRFRLKDDEGTTLAISPHGYKARPDVQKAIDAIKANAAKAKVDDQTKAK